ncbi:MAG TPA: prepilin-type N-terminal cleavage/methylation domain-containing protein [Pilimelia sp.]|nr:prepilin-type N-terminal cleavage/methylation domain-containing protein [Pilimelia sp.]
MRTPQPRPPDAGITLIEVMVSMTVMGVFLAMFTSSILQAFQAANKTESMSSAQSELHVAYQRLDREIRYAAALSEPGTSAAGNPVVEYLTTNNAGRSRTCNRLRLDRARGQLQILEWPEGTSPNLTAFRPIASGARFDPAAYPATAQPAGPFTRLPAVGGRVYPQLRVTLSTAAGAGTTRTSALTDVTFTALNAGAVPADGICPQQRDGS